MVGSTRSSARTSGGRAFWKPHRHGFELIQRRFALPPEAFVYVADNPAKDFVAPRALGWRTVQVVRPEGVHIEAVAAGVQAEAEIRVANFAADRRSFKAVSASSGTRQVKAFDLAGLHHPQPARRGLAGHATTRAERRHAPGHGADRAGQRDSSTALSRDGFGLASGGVEVTCRSVATTSRCAAELSRAAHSARSQTMSSCLR